MAHRPVVLCVLDGFGEGGDDEHNPIHHALTPTLDRLSAAHARTALGASGAAIGLAEGALGRGDAGYATLGAGRMFSPITAEIRRAIDDDKLGRNPVIEHTFDIVTYDKRPLHLVGLVSDSHNHAQFDHLLALLELASIFDVEVRVHAIVDGRDGAPRGCMDLLDTLQAHLDGGVGKIATVSGRYWAMDRDERWDRVYRAFHAIVRDSVLGPEAPQAEDVFDAISGAYLQDYDDAVIAPTRIGDYTGIEGDFRCDFSSPGSEWEWLGEDVGMAFNARGDRMHHLTAMLTRLDLPEEVSRDLLMDRHYPVRAFREHCFASLSDCGPGLDIPTAFRRATLDDGLAHAVAAAGMSQLRCGESERRVHLGRHFRGAPDAVRGEEQRLTKTPAYLDQYDEEPALAAERVATTVTDAIGAGAHEFIVVSLPNADLLGHDGDFEANIAAIQAVDTALGRIADAALAAGGAIAITSSHAGAEVHRDSEGARYCGHSANPVPFVVAGAGVGPLRDGGTLSDVAPTMLGLLGLDVPEGMTGRSLLKGSRSDED
jgi:2,3-bisphosphoglycerate-independent phosphoglycerate mutase